MAGDELTERQLGLIARLAGLDPAPWFMGGYAEDALLAGRVTRPHADVDVIFPRSESELRLGQAAELGFTDWETWGEAAPGEPFYLYGKHATDSELTLDLGLIDEADGKWLMRVHKLAFTVGGKEAPAGYQLQLPDDLFDHPPVELEGIAIKPIPPLALYQMRAGVAKRGSFGPLSDRHKATLAQLQERFFPHRTAEELLPPSLPLP